MNKKNMFERCLASSIAHAVMTNIYPDLDYEQSWDSNNFSIICNNERCTISFADDFCVGVVRNYEMNPHFGENIEKVIMKGFPNKVVMLSKREALLYLLDDIYGKPMCCATDAFWCDANTTYFSDGFSSKIVSLLLSDDKTFRDYIVTYYGMDLKTETLVAELLKMRLNNSPTHILLTKNHINRMPGEKIVSECVQSLNEIGFIFDEDFEGDNDDIYVY